jgi:hypothetical protein
MLTRYAALVFTILAFATSARAENAANTDIDLDFSVVTGLTGGPTSYLDGIKEMHWVLVVTNKCGLDEQHLRASAKSTFTKSKLGFVSSEEAPPEYFFDRPLFQIAITALPAEKSFRVTARDRKTARKTAKVFGKSGPGCAASISAQVIAPIEGARFVYNKKPVQKPSMLTIWQDRYGYRGQVIYEPNEQIVRKIEEIVDGLIRDSPDEP